MGSVCLSILVWCSSTVLKEIPWLFPLPHVSSVSRAAFVWCETGGPEEQSAVGSCIPLCGRRVWIPIRHLWIEAPGWTCKQPGAGSKDEVKPILKCSLLHSVEIGAYMPRDLILLLFHSLRQELPDNMEVVWFIFGGVFWVIFSCCCWKRG